MATMKMPCAVGSGGDSGTPKSAPLTSGTWTGNRHLVISGLPHKPVGFALFISNNKSFWAYGEKAYSATLSTTTEWCDVTYTDDGFETSANYGAADYTYSGYYFYNE